MANSAPGSLIGRGRNADVFGIGGGRVLRRYRDGRAPIAVAREAEIMTHARAHGVPVPEVFDVSGYDIVMEHAVGPTMLDVLGKRPWTFRAQARLLARLHGVVHAVPALGWLPAPFGDGSALLHGDLHAVNVILTAQGAVIIDWEGAASGPAPADIAMTWVIMAFSEIPGPRLRATAAGTVQALFARVFLRAAGLPDQSWLERAALYRLGDPNLLPSEKARLERLLRDGRFSGAGETGGSVPDN